MATILQIAQFALDSAYSVTSPDRRPEVAKAFRNAGIRLSQDGASVLEIHESDALRRMGTQLKGPLPTATLATKLVLAEHGVAH